MNYKTPFVILTLLSIAFSPFGKEAIAEDKSYYTLLDKVKSFDRSVDFKALRLSYTETSEYDPYNENTSETMAMFNALNSKQYKEAIKNALSILESSYVNIPAHIVLSISYRAIGDSGKSDFHDFVVKGLLDSIFDSGQGRSPESAYQVISIKEEYVILDVLGLEKKIQSLIVSGGHSYDRIEATNPKTGKTEVFYFNVDIPLGWLNKQFQKDK
ncbi:MAG: DUF4919 domain-containing protein [Nitrospirae bacterium]|nr:DUF4919 domain-containing protein [Nitrospirota bacterium]